MCKEFEHRFAAEDDMPMKLLYASVAAGKGSQPAALWLLETMKDTDHDTVRNLHSALKQLIYQHHARVPALLDYSQYPEVIDALDSIGDRRAVPVLHEMVRNEGRVFRDGKELLPKQAPERLIQSKIALATLEEGDVVPRLCALLDDKSFGEFDRRDVIWRLRDRPDPRAIPFLIKSIKNDPSGSVVNQAITVLSVFKYKTAVEGLIDCFDADFVGKSDWKRAYEPKMFQEKITESLCEITGPKTGPDKKKWLDWWQSESDQTLK